MKLPQITSTPQGFMTAGASPELLKQLLDEFQAVLLRNGFDLDATCHPGASRQQIIDAWGTQGITPPEEAIVWWQWHNGIKEGPTGRQHPGIDQISVEHSVRTYETMPKGDGEYSWDARWIPLLGDGPDRIVIDSDPSAARPTRVRSAHGGEGTYPPETENQAVSLCTPVTWWLLFRRKGWTIWTPDEWTTKREDIPREWLQTQLAHY